MAKIVTLYSAVLAFTSIFIGVSALPATTDTVSPEIIRGPGFPSPESLGITSEKLRRMVPVEVPKTNTAATPLEGRASLKNTCDSSALISTRFFRDHISFLQKIGERECGVTKAISTFVTGGGVAISGYALRGTTTAPCKDVAAGAMWVLDHCYWNDNYGFGGSALAAGNPNFMVVVHHG